MQWIQVHTTIQVAVLYNNVYMYLMFTGSSLITAHMGHIDTLDDLKSCTPSVLTDKVTFPCDVNASGYFLP